MQENQVTLVLGPASSGKSEWAEKLAKQSKRSVTYIATAIADHNDPAWQEKLQKHASRRPRAWVTQEVPTALAEAVQKGTAQECLLIDSLGTWVANLLTETETDWEVRVSQFLESLEQTASQVILVGEETGWGVIPAYKSGRLFRDRLGDLTRRVGENATEVYLVTGGYALPLKKIGYPLR
ncbi:MAG: bifunctional adenosylcobinamide kinase/adenosylcobinamide-phosphate guanylyltransferase [Halothece sp.]